MKHFYIKNNNKGYALLELIFYIAILSITALLVVQSILTMFNSFKHTSTNADLMQGAKILEKISREIRNADTMNIVSVLTPPSSGNIILTGKDNLDNNRTVQFTFLNNNIDFYENETLIGILNSSNIRVSNLNFTEVNFVRGSEIYDTDVTFTANSKAVLVDLVVESKRFGLIKSKNFSTTLVLRGSY